MTGVSAVRDSMGESYMMGADRGVIRAEAGGIKLEGGVFWYNKRSKIQ